MSDAPSSTTGLGRITRDLATRIAQHLPDVFRVATLGYGGPGSSALPFQQYAIQSPVTDNGWLVPELPRVWEDFAGDRRGVVLTIWDASRLRWFSQPKTCPYEALGEWLQAAPFERWGYFPIDATGPHDKLTGVLGQTIAAYDRRLAYSQWAARIIDRTLGIEGTKSLPHGIDTATFQPHDRQEAKRRFRDRGFVGLTSDAFLVGIVATNQPRKDFGLGIEVCAKLLEQGMNVRVWVHTDTPKRFWDLYALAHDFNLASRMVITTMPFTDEEMSWMYSACDVTLGVGLGEGFGYPIFESLASGTPVVHGLYGGAPEHLPINFCPDTSRFRLEGQFNCVRPVFDADRWAQFVNDVVNAPSVDITHLDWQNLWLRWEQWLRAGVTP